MQGQELQVRNYEETQELQARLGDDSDAGVSLSAYRNTASMRSIQVAEFVEIELANPNNVWKGKKI
jgi:hypothetical protein